MKRKFTTVVFAVLLLAAAGACSSGGNDDDAGLVGVTWRLIEYVERDSTTVAAVSNGTITFNSETQRATGSTGCNSFFADYAVDGDSITFTQIGATEIACAEPSGIMQQEALFLQVLGTATRFELDADGLRLIGGDGQLVFDGGAG